MPIKIFTTGGTIDKVYFDANSEFQVGEPQLGELLKEANVGFNYEIEQIFRKDSLEINEEDRALIRQNVLSDPAERILITHGTDTMVETGLELAGIHEKTIVLVGAMQPASLRTTDAIFNVGFALAALKLLPPGVYIAMNGEIFDPAHVKKNRAAARFESN